MTDNSNFPPSVQKGHKLKSLLFQGFVGTASLAGATAIPLIVQRVLTPPTPTASPAAVQASPLPQAATPLQVQSSPPDEESAAPERRRRNEREREKPPKD